MAEEAAGLSDLELVKRIFETPRRRAVIEQLIMAMCQAGRDDRRNVIYRIDCHGRRVCVRAEFTVSETLLPA